ncbi:MAG: Fe-S protein assembly co-chaperone HscB [Betaproteobacteria bacterium]|jgi:molecular chaperone HscB
MSAPDHFSLLALPARFAIDLGELEAAYKRVQTQVHPDRFAVASAAEKRVAMQWATRANEAFSVLRDPLRRAAYLCERHGAAIDAESNTTMPAPFLMRLMQWREALDEVTETASEADRMRLQAEVAAEHARIVAELGRKLDDEQDYAGAAALVRQLMFIDKFDREVAYAVRVAQGH